LKTRAKKGIQKGGGPPKGFVTRNTRKCRYGRDWKSFGGGLFGKKERKVFKEDFVGRGKGTVQLWGKAKGGKVQNKSSRERGTSNLPVTVGRGNRKLTGSRRGLKRDHLVKDCGVPRMT